MFAKFISKIPGFRTRRVWKRIIAVPVYIVLILLITSILSSGNKFTDTTTDTTIKIFQNVIVVLIILIPMTILTNIGDIRTKLPFLRGKGFWIRSISWLGIIIVLLIGFVSIYAALETSYSSEYVMAEGNYKTEQAAIKAQQDAAAIERKEEQRKAAEQKKQQLAEQKAAEKVKQEAEKAEQERFKQEKDALAAQQKEEERKAEEQRKLEAEAIKSKKTAQELGMQESTVPSKPVQPASEQAQSKPQGNQQPISSQEPAKQQPSPIQVMDGFRLIQADGFALQVPNTWHSVRSSFTKSLAARTSTKLDIDDTPIKETYDINFKTDMQFYSKIEIIQYDKNQDYEKFAKSKGYGRFKDDFKKIDFKYADAAFEWKDYKDSVGQKSSRELIVFKNDVCYIFYSYHEIAHTEGSWADIYREQIKQFRSDLESIYDSFQLMDDRITFKDVVQSEFKS